ncbi:sodium:proton antiporter, partial [bacterium]|nr:sodium:proton antiporter [bacterium]
LILVLGASIASIVGTTGASMLLIRPLIRANVTRKHVVHIFIFFIFMVSNIGGLLTPLGDPPLFLGFLKGVPFEWTLQLWRPWLFVNVILAIIFFVWDSVVYKKEEYIEEDKVTDKEPFKLEGLLNFVWLGGVVLSVAFLTPDFLGKLGVHPMGREVVMFVLIGLSLVLTSKELREYNEFNYHPIIEVAVLFVGIFVTMIPAINTLQLMGPTLGVSSPAQFFWFTGILSSFLDNAPTYVVFFELAGTLGLDPAVYGPIVVNNVPHSILAAISMGAVFMGANSYIGNGPNFMVKAIAEQSGIKMPSFFGYMAYSVGILIPVFLLVHYIFIT